MQPIINTAHGAQGWKSVMLKDPEKRITISISIKPEIVDRADALLLPGMSRSRLFERMITKAVEAIEEENKS